MSAKTSGRPARRRWRSAFLRRRRLAVLVAAAAPAVLLAAVLTVAVPTGSTATPGASEQATANPNPNYRRVALTSPGATIEILGEPEPLSTGGFSGEVSLARPEAEQAMVAANLALVPSGSAGDFGDASMVLRPGPTVDFRYDTSTQSIIFNPGVEIRLQSVPGLNPDGEPHFLYPLPIRLLPTEPVADPQYPPYGQTFRLPSEVVLWEGGSGVTGAEPVGLLLDFELTVTHPA